MAAGTLLCKLNERRANLLGLNAPSNLSVHVMPAPKQHVESSTTRIERMLAELCEMDKQQTTTNGASQDDDPNSSTH